MRIKHCYCKNKFGLLRFLNGYEIPYQAEDFWSTRTSVQVSDKNLYQLYFAETLPMEAITNKPIISCPKCGKTMIRIPNPVQKLVLDKNYLKDQTHVYKTGDVLTEQKMGYHTSFSILFHKNFISIAKDLVWIGVWCMNRWRCCKKLKLLNSKWQWFQGSVYDKTRI